MIINKSDVLNQFDDYREIISKATNLHLSLKKESKTFLRVYVLWSLSKRPELEKWLHNNYYVVSLSFLLEAFTCLMLNQTSGAQLLLRSSVENFIKFCLSTENLTIDNTRFKQNLKSLRTVYNDEKILQHISKLETIYHDLSKLSHSASSSEISIVNYIGQTLNVTELEFTNTITYIRKIIDIYLLFIFTICRESLKKWDSSDLRNTLKIGFKDNKVKSILHQLSFW